MNTKATLQIMHFKLGLFKIIKSILIFTGNIDTKRQNSSGSQNSSPTPNALRHLISPDVLRKLKRRPSPIRENLVESAQ